MNSKIPNYSDQQLYASKFMLNAEGFLFSANICKEQTDISASHAVATGGQSVGLGFIFPAAANYAFSCELFFKAAICMETSNEKRGHNLLKLYKKLSPSAGKIFIQVAKKTESEVEVILEENADMFQNARYLELEGVKIKELALMAESAKVTANILLKQKMVSGEFIGS